MTNDQREAIRDAAQAISGCDAEGYALNHDGTRCDVGQGEESRAIGSAMYARLVSAFAGMVDPTDRATAAKDSTGAALTGGADPPTWEELAAAMYDADDSPFKWTAADPVTRNLWVTIASDQFAGNQVFHDQHRRVVAAQAIIAKRGKPRDANATAPKPPAPVCSAGAHGCDRSSFHAHDAARAPVPSDAAEVVRLREELEGLRLASVNANTGETWSREARRLETERDSWRKTAETYQTTAQTRGEQADDFAARLRTLLTAIDTWHHAVVARKISLNHISAAVIDEAKRAREGMPMPTERVAEDGAEIGGAQADARGMREEIVQLKEWRNDAESAMREAVRAWDVRSAIGVAADAMRALLPESVKPVAYVYGGGDPQ